MRRYILLLLLVVGLLLVAAAAAAQNGARNGAGDSAPIVLTHRPEQMIQGEWRGIEINAVPLANSPASASGGAASDSCSTATLLTLSANGDGGSTLTNPMSPDAADPTLSCMWGAPSSSQGYRTVWYQFVAPSNGRAIIDTAGSNYDTVLAVHTGTCGSLVEAACSDDAQGFNSRVAFNVSQGTTYYIEVADWESAAPTAKTLNLSLLMEPINSKWEQQAAMPLPRSRHAAVVVGGDIYVIGGQTVLLGTPEITNQLERYNTATGQWTTLNPTPPGPSYSNTTAAYINGRIYVPNGYNGNNTTFDNTHWAYDIASNKWLTQTIAPGAPFAWASAVVHPNQTGYYLTGGISNQPAFTTTDQVRADVLFYDVASGIWLTNVPPMNSPRYAHTAAWVNGQVCVAGGIGGTNNYALLIDGECYTPGSGVWAAIPNMNFPRYAAGSAVGPDGKWYVFGGIDGAGNAVSVVEVYDPAANTWTPLDVSYDLGGTASTPARGWPRGVFAGSWLWAIGGNSMPESQVMPLVEKLFVPTHEQLLPFIARDFNAANQPDDTFAAARPLALNQAQLQNFDNLNDFYDVYVFDLTSTTAVTVKLTQIPADSNYDVVVYNDNKGIQGEGNNVGLGVNETVTLNGLPSGRYYVMVKRIWPGGDPNPANYRLIVEG
ncbi:MAG: kelch repeat-containing protein [Anaerolineae bacterium]